MTVQKNNAKPKLEPLGMVGRCFIFWGETTWNYQGIIRGEPSPWWNQEIDAGLAVHKSPRGLCSRGAFFKAI
jgi:hypothetical protein